MPWLAPQLPLPIPRVAAAGEPEPAFPHHWYVYEWLPGERTTLAALHDPIEAAIAMATFVRALHALDATNGPDHHRGHPVRLCDASLRAGIFSWVVLAGYLAFVPPQTAVRWLETARAAATSARATLLRPMAELPRRG